MIQPYPKTKVALLVSSMLTAGYAYSQEKNNSVEVEKEFEQIVVTGTRIKRKDLVKSSPTVTTDAEDFARAGTPTMDSYLRQLPQFQPGQGDFSNTSSGGTVGQSTLNLRGLGPQRNLVILDGRRLQSSNANGAIDINTIPSMAISGVEIVSGGASATYGSDAMSGVVNFTTRSDLQGLEATAKITQPKDGDGTGTVYGIAWGGDIADARGYAFIGAEYLDRDGINVQDRAFFKNQVASGFSPFSRTLPDTAPSQAAVDNLFASYGIEGVSNRSFFGVNNDGSVFAVSRGMAVNYKGPTEPPFLVGEDGSFGYHPGFQNYVQVPLERSAVFGKANYALNGDTSLYGHFQYSKSEAQNIGSEPVLAAPWSVFVPVDNPYVQANDDFAGLLASRNDPGAPVEYQVRLGAAGPRTYNTESEVFQGLAGINGYLPDIDLSWDLHVSIGRATNTDTTTSGSVSYVAMQELVDQPDGGDSLCSAGYQVFNGLNQLSEECLAYISRTPENETVLEQTVVEGLIEGLLTELPAGDMRFAVGAHYRKNEYEFTPDAEIAANNLASLSASQFTQGKIDVKEFSAEVYIPLLSGEAIAESLNLTLGYRFSDYNLAGTANTYKAEFDWRPVDNLLLRSGFQRALRAPNVEEFFNAGTQQVSGIGSPTNGAGDPCDYRHTGLSGPNSDAISELCIATGLTDSLMGQFRQPSNALVTTTYGDSTLKPEEADSMTFGAVLESPWSGKYTENMSITLDYYYIEIDKAIAAIPADQSLAKCYNLDGSNPTYDTENFFCQQFDRQPGGIFNYVNQPYLNLGGYKTSGLDISFNWQVPATFVNDSAKLSVDSFASRLSKFEIAVFDDSPFQDFKGTVSETESYPEWKLVNSITFNDENYSLTARWRYISSMADSSTVTNLNSQTAGSASYSYIDLTGSYQLTDSLALRAGVNNVTDKEPPIIGGSIGVTNRGVFDSVGRTAYLEATYKL